MAKKRNTLKRKGGITGRALVCWLLANIKNLDAVVTLCETDREYTAFTKAIDDSQKADKDGAIGNICLCIESNRRKA